MGQTGAIRCNVGGYESKWAKRLWAQELANVIKRMYDISIRIEKALQSGENGPGGLGPKNWQMS